MSVVLACAALLLVTRLQAGESLKCYESSCLKDHSMKSIQCHNEDTSKLQLEECTPDSFTKRWSDVTKEKLTSNEMKCVKLDGRGALPKARTGLDVIRMCAPQMQDMCSILSTLVSTKIEHSEVMDLRLHFECDICDTDGCNSAQRHTMITSVLLVTFGITVFLAF